MEKPQLDAESRKFLMKFGMSYNLEGNKEKFPQFAKYFDMVPKEEVREDGYVHEIVLEECWGVNRYRLFWLHAVKHTLLQWESEEDWEKKCRELEEEITKEEMA